MTDSKKRKAPSKPKPKPKPKTKGKGTNERQSREDPLLNSSDAVPNSFSFLDDVYSCHSRLDNQKDFYELFLLCRTLFKMMVDHRRFLPSSVFGKDMYTILHGHAYSEGLQGTLQFLFRDVLMYWAKIRSTCTSVAATVVRIVQQLQQDTWYPHELLLQSRGSQEQLPCPSEGIRVLFLLPKKIGVAHIRNMIQACRALEPTRHFVVVHRGKLTVDCLNTLDDFNQTESDIRMEHHLWDTLLIYPYDVKLVPLHRLATVYERDQYLKEHSLEFDKLMPLHIHDPMVRFHGFSVGDAIVVIEREASGHIMQMFCVVSNPLEGLGGSPNKPHAMQPLLTKAIHTLPANAKKITQLRKG